MTVQWCRDELLAWSVCQPRPCKVKSQSQSCGLTWSCCPARTKAKTHAGFVECTHAPSLISPHLASYLFMINFTFTSHTDVSFIFKCFLWGERLTAAEMRRIWLSCDQSKFMVQLVFKLFCQDLQMILWRQHKTLQLESRSYLAARRLHRHLRWCPTWRLWSHDRESRCWCRRPRSRCPGTGWDTHLAQCH